jgi:hypothetical protein
MVRWHISQRVTGSWVTVTGKRREDELLIWLYDSSPPGVILPCACTERDPRGMRACMEARIDYKRRSGKLCEKQTTDATSEAIY